MTSEEVKLMPLVTLWPLWVLRLNLSYDLEVLNNLLFNDNL